MLRPGREDLSQGVASYAALKYTRAGCWLRRMAQRSAAPDNSPRILIVPIRWKCGTGGMHYSNSTAVPDLPRILHSVLEV